MLEQIIAMMKEFEQNDELFAIGARLIKKSYDALVEAGFNEAQATQIVATQGAIVKAS